MKNILSSLIKEFIKVVIIVAIAVPTIALFAAWTGPTGAPPTNNADAPINVGPVDQIKTGGWLSLGNLISRGTTLLARDDGNVGIGVTDSPTEKLDVEGFVKGRAGLCIGDDCRMAWPFSEDGLPPGVKLVPANLNEDIYGSWMGSVYVYRVPSDTCNNSHETEFYCSPSDVRKCKDILIPVGQPQTNSVRYNSFPVVIRDVECKISLALGVDSWKAEKLIGTAEIIDRDYGGSSEKCTVRFTSAVSNWEKTNIGVGSWNDGKCKDWIEKGIKFGGTWFSFDRPGYCRFLLDSRPECASFKSGFFVPELKNIISAKWLLSGSSGPVEILYIPE